MESLSMRNLAQELGVVPMALYKHVANKEELVNAMVDIVFGEAVFPTDGAWKPTMRRRAISMRHALLRHPWAIGRMESGTPGPANLRHHNATMGCLREAGFSFPVAVHAYSLMDSYIYGFALQEKTLPADIPAEAETRTKELEEQHPAPVEEYPYLMDVAEQLAKSGYDPTKEFEIGLDLILDGIEELQRAGSRSRRRATKTRP